MNIQNSFELLRKKDILLILQGDAALGDKDDSLCHMPYLTGQELQDLCLGFGLHTMPKQSRWVYMDELIHYMSEKNRCGELLNYLFDKSHFEHLSRLRSPEEVEGKYQEICNAAINKINSHLLLSNNELVFQTGNFYIRNRNDKTPISAPNVSRISQDYVRDLAKRCEQDFSIGNYDSVLSKSRTLIEEILLYILESRNVTIEARKNIKKLYSQVKDILNMHQNNSFDARVNSLLYGLERIIEAVGDMRNINSDAHGVGNKRIQIQDREARLVMNSSIVFCEYLLSIGAPQ